MPSIKRTRALLIIDERYELLNRHFVLRFSPFIVAAKLA